MPNQGVPVIFKNKVAYGYAEKSVQAYDVSVSDYNALTEQQQLDGSIRFIQGVDAVPNGNNVWAKLGTTPLAEGLPRDCSQAVNELKSNLTYNVLSGSSAFTPTSGTTVSKAELHKFGKVVTLYLQGSRSSYTANAYTKIGEIPSDYAPSSQAILMSLRPDMNQAVGYISISNTGEITMYRTSATGTNLYFTLTWVI